MSKPKIKIKLIDQLKLKEQIPAITDQKIKIIKREDKHKKQDTTKSHEQIYHTIKCPLKSVLKKYDLLHPIIEQTVTEMNQIAILGYQFIRLFVIDRYDHNLELPHIDKQWILDVLTTICHVGSQRGPKKKRERLETLVELREFYESNFNIHLHTEQPSYLHKSHLIAHLADEMLTCIETNLSTNFIKYLSKYINCLFRRPKSKEFIR